MARFGRRQPPKPHIGNGRPPAVAMPAYVPPARTGKLPLVVGSLDNDEMQTTDQLEYARIQDGVGLSVVARSYNTHGANADLVAPFDGAALVRSGNSLVFGQVGTAGIAPGTNITGNAATVTTNANLTGPVTSVGNATTIADAELAALAGLTSAADKLPYFTGSGTAALAAFAAAARNLLALTTVVPCQQGCICSNAADASNDITVSAGKWSDDTLADYMVLPSAITKQLDATSGGAGGTGQWVAGTNASGRDAGSEASSTQYHVFLIKNPTSGVVDVLFSTSLSSPTMPSGYTLKRRIFTIYNMSSSVIRPFKQVGDDVLWVDAVSVIDTVHPGTSAVTVDLSASGTAPKGGGVPTGFIVDARIRVMLKDATVNNNVLVSSLVQTDAAPTSTDTPLSSVQSSTTTRGRTEFSIRTDSSGQIRYRCGNSTAADTTVSIVVVGYRDTRGRDD